MGPHRTLHACEQEESAPTLMAIAQGAGRRLRAIGALPAAGQDFDTIAGDSGRSAQATPIWGIRSLLAGALCAGVDPQ